MIFYLACHVLAFEELSLNRPFTIPAEIPHAPHPCDRNTSTRHAPATHSSSAATRHASHATLDFKPRRRHSTLPTTKKQPRQAHSLTTSSDKQGERFGAARAARVYRRALGVVYVCACGRRRCPVAVAPRFRPAASFSFFSRMGRRRRPGRRRQGRQGRPQEVEGSRRPRTIHSAGMARRLPAAAAGVERWECACVFMGGDHRRRGGARG